MATGSEFGVLEPLVKLVSSAIGSLKYVLGGIFGIYVVLVIVKIYQGFVFRRELKELRTDIKKMRESVQRIEDFQERHVRKV
ncbi:hypothetical protein HYY69_01670 [Candidatus Woesearchaeota archaeon]|nr:hypothetical protein [Candidatus Woesearchaeota archaeon]